MTTLRRMKFLQCYADRHGRPRYYFRRKGQPLIAIKGTFGSQEFLTSYAAAMESAPIAIGAKRTTAGSLNSLIKGYTSSLGFAKLSPVTQKQYTKRMAWIARDYGSQSIATLRRQHIVKMIDGMSTPSMARDFLAMLRVLIQYAIGLNLIEVDPSIGVKVTLEKSEGFHTWTEPEVARFRKHHALGSRARLALELLLATAVRVSDVVKLGSGHIKGGVINIPSTQKTGQPVTLPVMAELEAAIAATPTIGIATFLVNEHGRPFTPEQMTKWFSQQCLDAGLKGCTAHGLRKLACVRLAHAGATAPEIMAVSGHRSLKVASRYIEQASREKLAAAAVNKLRTMPSV